MELLKYIVSAVVVLVAVLTTGISPSTPGTSIADENHGLRNTNKTSGNLTLEQSPVLATVKYKNISYTTEDTIKTLPTKKILKSEQINLNVTNSETIRNSNYGKLSKLINMRNITRDVVLNNFSYNNTNLTNSLYFNKSNLQSYNKYLPASGLDSNRRYKFGKGRREVPGDETDPCAAFEIGDQKNKIFYSPGYPNNYHKSIDCTRVLTAPPGYQITLDFRDFFNIEPSEKCDYDYLEVMDGAYGFSNPLGKYCGRAFPGIIVSKERYLWLHFKSDDNIEYAGFIAVYEFTPRPANQSSPPDMEMCLIEHGGNEGVILRDDIPKEREKIVKDYSLILDCMWVITVQPGWRIFLHFNTFSLSKPNECDKNVVDIFENRTDNAAKIKNFCGSAADNAFSKSNILYVRFLATAAALDKSKFEILYTAYRERSKDENCKTDTEYDCEDQTCISADLECNKHVNCRFGWDEDDCPVDEKEGDMESDNIVTILVIFSLILAGLCIAFVVSCIRKLMRDHEIIQEHIRQSRENDLDEIGRKSTKTPEEITKHGHSKRRSPSPDANQTQHNLAVDSLNCYVPTDTLIPIIQKKNSNLNNGDIFIRDNRSNELLRKRGDMELQLHETEERQYDSDDLMGSGNTNELEQIPEMCDSACQTRESLFRPQLSTSSGTDSPHVLSSHGTLVRDRGVQSPRFSTFGYDDSRNRIDQQASLAKQSERYKAEAVIEMEQIRDKSRSKTTTNPEYDSNRTIISTTTPTPPIGWDIQKSNVPHSFSRSPQNYRVHDSSSKKHEANRNKNYNENVNKHDLKENRGFSVETTKSAPDVIIMTSH